MKLIPELRFPEFKSNGSWKASKIGSFAKVSSGGTPSSNEPKYWGGEIPWMNSGELNLKRVYDVENRITELGLKESSTKKIPSLCILIGLAGQGKTRGTAAINYIELCTNQSIAAIHPNKSKFDSEFLFQKVDSLYQKLRRLSTGQGGRGGLNLSIIREIKIPLPSLEEQQKIASCLSSLDDLIAAHIDKLDALKDHKKGLLQNFFPQEGETVPKVRFPEFENDGEWVEDDIGSLFKFKQGVQVPVGNQFTEQEDDMVRFIRIIDITSNTEPPRYIENPGDAHVISANDLFMIRYGTPGLISIGFEGVIANNLFRLIWKSEKRNQPKYWFYAFQRLESFIYNLSSSSSMPAISFSTLEGLKISFPPTIKEQHKIASCISAVDELITAQQEKIEQLKKHKKGLMQGLFPKIES